MNRPPHPSLRPGPAALPALWLAVLLALAAGLAPLRAATHDLVATRNLFHSGEYQKVVSATQAAIGDNLSSEEWRRLLAESLLRTGRYPEAVNAVSNSLGRYGFSLTFRVLAHDVFRAAGQADLAAQQMEIAEQIIQTRTSLAGSAQTLTAVGHVLLQRGADPKDILDKIYGQARTLEPDAREPRLAIGELSLAKKDFALAAKTFEEGVAKFPSDPDFLVGLAAAHEADDRTVMIESLGTALALNPSHARARLLLAEHAIAAEEYTEAEKQLDKVLGVNPWLPEAWAFRAVLAHLRNQPDRERDARRSALRWWTNNPAVDHLIGAQLSAKYRFAEGADYQRQALAFDPAFAPAKVQLAQDLLRLGRTDEGWKLVEEAHEADAYDVESFNLATLKDSMAQFATLTNAWFVVRMSQHEAKVYGDRVMALLERARTNLCEKYGLQLDEPVTVEIFPNQSDFGVRTFGLPHNPGFLGVCFGKVITANSPASAGGNPSNWEAVLWHEFAHVVTLTLTKNKMPRWLSEGISVHEELAANPTWGQQMTPGYRQRILDGKLTPLSELSAAFLTASDGNDIQFAYYQSALAVEFLNARYGVAALRNILRDLGKGTEINAAIAAHTAPMAALEKDFATFAKERAENLAPGLDFDEPIATVPTSVEMLAKLHPKNFYILTRQAKEFLRAKQWNEALVPLQTLRTAYPNQTGADSAHALLAAAYRGLGDTNSERAALEQWAAIDTTALPAFERLMVLATERGDWEAVRLNAQRYIAVNPLAPLARRRLAEAQDATRRFGEAASEWQAFLALDPADRAEAHFLVARSLHRAGAPAQAKPYALAAVAEAPRYREALRLLEDVFRDAPYGTPTTPASAIP